VNREKWESRSEKKGKKYMVDKETAGRDHRGVQHRGYTLKSEASLTGFAVSPRIARTLQRCENFTCARVFPTSISTYLFPALGALFFPRPARGLIPRLIAHAEQTIFFFYYFVLVRIVCLLRRRSTIVRQKRFEETGLRESQSNRMLQNLVSLVSEKIWRYS